MENRCCVSIRNSRRDASSAVHVVDSGARRLLATQKARRPFCRLLPFLFRFVFATPKYRTFFGNCTSSAFHSGSVNLVVSPIISPQICDLCSPANNLSTSLASRCGTISLMSRIWMSRSALSASMAICLLAIRLMCSFCSFELNLSGPGSSRMRPEEAVHLVIRLAALAAASPGGACPPSSAASPTSGRERLPSAPVSIGSIMYSSSSSPMGVQSGVFPPLSSPASGRVMIPSGPMCILDTRAQPALLLSTGPPTMCDISILRSGPFLFLPDPQLTAGPRCGCLQSLLTALLWRSML